MVNLGTQVADSCRGHGSMRAGGALLPGHSDVPGLFAVSHCHGPGVPFVLDRHAQDMEIVLE